MSARVCVCVQQSKCKKGEVFQCLELTECHQSGLGKVEKTLRQSEAGTERWTSGSEGPHTGHLQAVGLIELINHSTTVLVISMSIAMKRHHDALIKEAHLIGVASLQFSP